jgi:hypothetical protein
MNIGSVRPPQNPKISDIPPKMWSDAWATPHRQKIAIDTRIRSICNPVISGITRRLLVAAENRV